MRGAATVLSSLPDRRSSPLTVHAKPRVHLPNLWEGWLWSTESIGGEIYGGGIKSPKGLYIRQPRASAASPWERMPIFRTLKGFNREHSKRGRGEILLQRKCQMEGAKGGNLLCPFRARSVTGVTQGGASLALGYRMWNPFRILSHPNLPVFVSGVCVSDGARRFNFSEPSHEFGGGTHASSRSGGLAIRILFPLVFP